MKNLKKILHASVIALGLFTAAESQAQTIPSTFFGQNAWMPDSIGTKHYGGKLHQNWGNIKDSKAQVIRFGGISADRERPTNFQYIKMIDSIRAKGMEPVIQVSYHDGKFNAQQAADVVQYINITKGKNIKYWVIGNEPDLEYSYTSASQVAAYIKPFASAMKAVDPTIKTIGPETAWFNESIINGLTQPNGPYDITGKDANGRYYIDVISFHTYPFSGGQNRDQVVSKLTESGGFQDKLAYLNGRIAACNSTHGRTGTSVLQTAVTEMNINYKNSASDNVTGLGANSFIGGQFIAEMFGIGLKQGVSMMNIWSVIEGNSQELNIGYLDRTTGAKKPAYYHFKLMAENFKGSYVNGTTNNAKVKVFGSKTSQYTQVLIMNQDQGASQNYVVRLNQSAIAGNAALKINMSADVNVEYNGVIGKETTQLLTFNASGVLVKKTEYSQTNAIAGQAPVVTEYNGGVPSTSNGGGLTTAVEENASDFISMKGFTMNLYPNPAKSKFTIELDRPNKQEVKFQVEVYDLMGRLIHSQTSVFAERRQQLDLTGNSLAEAVYIVRVREAGDKENWRASKIILFK
jgi:hypothetical protein